MSKITNNPFLAKCPYIDIHAEYSEIAKVLINQFINDNLKMQEEKILILHGKGTDVLRKTTHELLKHHPAVKKYYYDGINYGLTVVELNLIDNLKGKWYNIIPKKYCRY